MMFLLATFMQVFGREGAARSTFVTRKSAAECASSQFRTWLAPFEAGRAARPSLRTGFTLIETMVYLSLFSILMSGVVVSAYNIFEATGRSQTRAMMQEEGDFLIGKIDWALSGIQTVNAPITPSGGIACTESDTLSVTKWDGTIGTVIINLSGDSAMLARLGNLANSTPLNNSNTAVSNLLFKHCGTGGNNPERVEAKFTLTARTPNGALMTREFFTSDYVRK